jgi:uroporphyrinogen-III decarboxylase
MANMMLTMGKALLKHKLHVGTLTGMERFMVAAVTLADRAATFLAATNIEPDLIDTKFDYELLSKSVEANLELFGLVRQRIHADIVAVPIWMGLMHLGPADLGTVFKVEKRRVPYSVDYPIKKQEDIAKIKIPQQASGYLKMYFDINKEVQRRYPDSLAMVTLDGPWDLAMLLRGDRELPMDLRVYRDYTEAKDQATRDKIRRFGNPDVYPAIMELTTQLAIRQFQLAVENGLSLMGSALVDQYASKPIMSREDYFKYVHPYRIRVWEALDKKVGPGYVVPSPQETEQNLQDAVLGKGLGGITNYIFPQTPEGLTLPEYDQPMLELAKKYKQSYSYMVHGKYLRDASESQLDATVQRICRMATEVRVNLMVSIASVPPGASVEKANYVFQRVEKYGRY